MTPAEYLKSERVADEKHEFLGGELFAMSGGSHLHSLIATNLAGELRNRLKGKPGQTLNSDMRVKVVATGLYAYPDVQVACGDLEFEDDHQDSLLNPKVIVEVLSPTTASWDRGKKFWHYRHLESLADYVLVAQDEWLIEHYRLQPNGGWLLETVEGAGATLRLESVGCEIPLAEIYEGTRLEAKAR